jgi:hypothetical protein
MKKILLIPIICLFTFSNVTADDFVYHGSFLWNDIRGVVQRGDFLFCAFHDGIGAVDLSQGFNKKKLHSTLELAGPPLNLYLFDDLVLAELESGLISLVNISNPDEMILLGSFDPELELFDLERIGDFVYAAVEYDGLLRYDISDPGNIHFDDSSMAGISVTRLFTYQSRLYALDTYNGILIYEPNADSIGEPISRLLLPDQAISFTVANDTVYAGIKLTGYAVGSVADPFNPEYLESRESFIRADEIATTTMGLVVANSISGFELIYGSGEDQIDQLFPVTGVRGYPELFNYGGSNYIAYSHVNFGFAAYEIDDPFMIILEHPSFVYASPGPITQLKFVKSRLHVIGTYNWYEIYDLSNPSVPTRTGKMINPPYKPAGVCTKGDTLFVADIQTSTFFPAVDEGIGDPQPISMIFSVVDSVGRPHIIPDYFGHADLLYFHNDKMFNGTVRNDTSVTPNYIRWSFATGITAMAIDGRNVYRASSKNMLYSYTMDKDNDLNDEYQTEISGRFNQILIVDTLMYLAGGSLVTASISDPLRPVLVNTQDDIGLVYEMQLVGSWLICATGSGVHIFDISNGIPEPLFSGGSKAALLAYDDHVLAASDSHSVRIYTIPLVDTDDDHPIPIMSDLPVISGYPNPFNPSITIVLKNFRNIENKLDIEIFDILGRQVRRLKIADLRAGRSEISWDGRDEDGRPMTSGIYLFRANNGTESAVFKAVLLK